MIDFIRRLRGGPFRFTDPATGVTYTVDVRTGRVTYATANADLRLSVPLNRQHVFDVGGVEQMTVDQDGVHVPGTASFGTLTVGTLTAGEVNFPAGGAQAAPLTRYLSGSYTPAFAGWYGWGEANFVGLQKNGVYWAFNDIAMVHLSLTWTSASKPGGGPYPWVVTLPTGFVGDVGVGVVRFSGVTPPAGCIGGYHAHAVSGEEYVSGTGFLRFASIKDADSPVGWDNATIQQFVGGGSLTATVLLSLL